MKKMILTLAIAISSLVGFASEKRNVNAVVLNSFTTEFGQASDVQWTAGADFYKANFKLNGKYVSAFFSTDGSLLGITRNISSLELPNKLQLSIRKDYKNFWIADLFEVTNANGTEYYITLENADGKMTLKADATSNWTSFKKKVKI